MNNNSKLQKKWAVTFSGGGARGAYEIGCWKAFKEMHLEIEAVAGTSIGALNGALLVQGDYDKALEIWSEITPELLFDTEQKGLNRYRDTSKLRSLLEGYIDEERFFDSNIDFCLTTFNVTSLKPEIVFKEDIPRGKLIDYLMASANYPVFKRQEIDGELYIDGGLYDNMPTIPLIERGYDHIIRIDIRDMLGMRTRKVGQTNAELITIHSRHSLSGVLHFTPEVIFSNIHYGYYDTLQAFDKLKGSIYYIDTDNEKSSFCLTAEDFIKLRQNESTKDFVQKENLVKKCLETMNSIMNANEYYSITSPEFFLCGLEVLCDCLDIPDYLLYTPDDLLALAYKSLLNLKEEQNNLLGFIAENAVNSFEEGHFDNFPSHKRIILGILLYASQGNRAIYAFILSQFPKMGISYLFANLLLSKML